MSPAPVRACRNDKYAIQCLRFFPLACYELAKWDGDILLVSTFLLYFWTPGSFLFRKHLSHDYVHPARSTTSPSSTISAPVQRARRAAAPLSALKIDRLKLSGETYKPYRCMRGRKLGRVEWRSGREDKRMGFPSGKEKGPRIRRSRDCQQILEC